MMTSMICSFAVAGVMGYLAVRLGSSAVKQEPKLQPIPVRMNKRRR